MSALTKFFPRPGSRIPRMRFHVAGYCLVKDNKIQDWRGFGSPGAKPFIQSTPIA